MLRSWTSAQPVVAFVLLFGWISGSPSQGRGHTTVQECEGMKIGVLDLNDFSEAAQVPLCSLTDVHVDMKNGVVYSTSFPRENVLPHQYGTHSAPWFLRGAIQTSKYYTRNLEEADIIYVYDYCHYVVWLGYVHAYGEKEAHEPGPGDNLVAVYREMLKMPLWKKSEGGHFAFYDPHPGFWQGQASHDVRHLRCSIFRNTIHLIMDTPMRNLCEQFWLMKKIIVTPYVPNPLEVKNPRSYLHLPYKSLEERPIMAYSRATCHDWKAHDAFAGKLMRYWFSYIEWGNNTEMDVRCVDPELNSEGHLDFLTMFNSMRASKICPVFPGDSASTRRLSEIFLAGCVPAFLGPPYHSMPFGETVPYKQLGIFFNVSETVHWLRDVKPEWKLHPEIRAEVENEARWWVPDVDIEDALINVAKPSDVYPALKAIPQSVLATKARLMHEYGSRFSFLQRLTDPPNAANSLIAAMCIKQKQHPAKHKLAG